MVERDPQGELARLTAESGVGYAALSRMIRRNHAYLHQFVTRGSPRVLAERDRRLLAAFFRVDEAVLGGPASGGEREQVTIGRLDMAASAGHGGLGEDDWPAGAMTVDLQLIARLRLDPAHARFLPAMGESMQPGICDGDLMLVDERDRRVGSRGAVFVLRLDGALMVKRLSRGGDHRIKVTSDNPDFPPTPSRLPGEVEVIGRVVWLSRALR